MLAEIRDTPGKTRYPAQMFMALYQAAVEIDDVLPRTVPAYCITLPRVLITPCRVCVTGFQIEVSNRLVRKFIQNYGFSAEAFIRVTIGDENGDKLFSDDLSGPVATRIQDLVLNGLQIVGKKYNFLAYSSSQLKELSLWMVCPENGWSVQQMRESMGDFSMCNTPALYAARIGQCFSTTVDTVGVEENRINGASRNLQVKDDLPDIEALNHYIGTSYVHSDGVGLIKKEVLKDLMLRYPFRSKNQGDVSAIQIRYGGAKGVLVGWDFNKLNDQRLCGFDVCLRPSMVKFKAPYDQIEIVNIASHIPYYLNRNVILLLSHHGISNNIFLDMQAEMLTKLNRMLVDAEFAATFLPTLSGPGNWLVSTLCNMLEAGLEPHKDPFLFSCLHAIRAHHLMNLRKKARIHVEKGAVLIGGIDETGLLREGEVFIQVCRSDVPDGNHPGFSPLVGPVLVTKHPVMHPGDVRMLKAVDIPHLRDKRNVILFSQHGERPEADKMSGSDLDGDQFAITWDERLFLNDSSSPMDYSPSKKPTESDGINDETLLKHFINHARNDNLGHIAMLWMDHAVLAGDAGCNECLELAQLHSIAVDFPKTGIPAVIPDTLKIKSTVPRAHWREKKGSPSFHCNSIVGQLYDQVVAEINSPRRVPRANDIIALAGRRYDKNGQILCFGQPDRLFESKERIFSPEIGMVLGFASSNNNLDPILQEYANEQCQQYENQLFDIMKQYNIKCEGEIITGCIRKYHKLHKRRRHNVTEEIRQQIQSIRNEFRSEFIKAVYHLVHNNINYFIGESDNDEEDVNEANDDVEYEMEDLDWIEAAITSSQKLTTSNENDVETLIRYAQRLAVAYYNATYSPEMHVMGSQSVLYSFPWIVISDVITIALQK